MAIRKSVVSVGQTSCTFITNFISSYTKKKTPKQKNPPPPKSPKTHQKLFAFLKSVFGMYSQQCRIWEKKNTSFSGSQVRRLVYTVSGMKSFHNTARYNPENLQHLIFISFVHSADSLRTIFQKQLRLVPIFFNRSPVEGIKKAHHPFSDRNHLPIGLTGLEEQVCSCNLHI